MFCLGKGETKVLLISMFCFQQAACVSVCQYLTAARVNNEMDTEESDSDSEGAPSHPQPTPPEPVPTVMGKQQKPKKAPRPQIPPPPPEVTRIMEMGFQRKQVEYAIKSLGESHILDLFLYTAMICSWRR